MKSIITVVSLLVVAVFGTGINPTLNVIERFFSVGNDVEDALFGMLGHWSAPWFLVLLFIGVAIYWIRVSDDARCAAEEATMQAKKEERKVYCSSADTITSKVVRMEQAKALKAEYAARAINVGKAV